MRATVRPSAALIIVGAAMSAGCSQWMREDAIDSIASAVQPANGALVAHFETIPNPLGQGLVVFVRSESSCAPKYAWIWLNSEAPRYALDAASQVLTPRLKTLSDASSRTLDRVGGDAEALRQPLPKWICESSREQRLVVRPPRIQKRHNQAGRNEMKSMIVVSALLLAPAATVAQDNPRALLDAVRTVITEQNAATGKPKDPTGQMLIANERALREAVIMNDKATFQSLVLPEGVWTTKTGFIPFKLLADGLGTFHVATWDMVNPHVTWLDKDSAIVLYTWTGTGRFQNQPLAPTTLASTVWTRRDGKWLAAHHQETDLTKN